MREVALTSVPRGWFHPSVDELRRAHLQRASTGQPARFRDAGPGGGGGGGGQRIHKAQCTATMALSPTIRFIVPMWCHARSCSGAGIPAAGGTPAFVGRYAAPAHGKPNLLLRVEMHDDSTFLAPRSQRPDRRRLTFAARGT